jgi:uncharacterized protein
VRYMLSAGISRLGVGTIVMPWTGILALLISLLGAYVAFGVVLFVFQNSLVYFPEAKMVGTPHDIQRSYEAIYFKSKDNVELFGWFVPTPNPKGTILFCHGNAGNISNRLDYLGIFNRLEFNTFIFDYRGYGLSGGRPSEEGTYLDAQAAWEFLTNKKGLSPDRIVLYGESLGGAVAAHLAAKQSPGALILASSFTSLPELGSEIYRLFPVRWLSRFSYDTLEFMKHVKCPTLVIHSPEDDIVPFSQGRELFNASPGPKELLTIKGDHNTGFLVSGDVYVRGIERFTSKYLPLSTPLR